MKISVKFFFHDKTSFLDKCFYYFYTYMQQGLKSINHDNFYNLACSPQWWYRYLSEVCVVNVSYHVEEEPVNLPDDLVKVGRKVVPVLHKRDMLVINTGIHQQEYVSLNIFCIFLIEPGNKLPPFFLRYR